MDIIYIGNFCSNKMYKKLYPKNHNGIANQKYNKLMVEGLTKNLGVKVTVISGLYMSPAISEKFFFHRLVEEEDNVTFSYLPFLNIKIIRQLMLVILTFKEIMKKSDIDFIVCETLSVSLSFGVLLAKVFKKLKIIGLTLDLPGYVSNRKEFFSKNINKAILKKCDAYIFLTNQMSEVVNKNKKPYLVLEGLVDINIKNVENKLKKKSNKDVCIYAGSLKKVYGIKKLVEAFVCLNIENRELHIYGDGDYKDELLDVIKKIKNIKYYGIIDNSLVMEEEMKAILLINPRPTNEEYTKYSFPSKNMEYMVSGTPMLTTKLPGMPKEYYDYVYLLEDERVEGIKNKLEEILSKDKKELHEFGLRAKEFVLREKNNVIQTKKIIDLMKKINGV